MQAKNMRECRPNVSGALEVRSTSTRYTSLRIDGFMSANQKDIRESAIQVKGPMLLTSSVKTWKSRLVDD